MGTAEKPRRTNDPAGMRLRLIEVAFRSFANRGYNATPVHDLRREAAVTGGAFSHHFSTKKALGLAVLQERVAQAVEEAWIKPLLSATSTAEGVRTAFEQIIGALREQVAIAGCPLNNFALEISGQDAQMREAVDLIFRRWHGIITAKILDDQRSGQLCWLEPEAGATFIIAAYSGAMTMAKASRSTLPLEQCADQLAAYLSGEVVRHRNT
jgi:AcrR family transcriptional regulator